MPVSYLSILEPLARQESEEDMEQSVSDRGRYVEYYDLMGSVIMRDCTRAYSMTTISAEGIM